MEEEIEVIHTASRFHALNHCTLLSLLIDIFTLIFQRHLQRKMPKMELLVSLLSILLLFQSSPSQQMIPMAIQSLKYTFRSYSYPLFFPTPRFQLVPQVYQFSLKNVSEIHLLFFISTTTTLI